MECDGSEAQIELIAIGLTRFVMSDISIDFPVVAVFTTYGCDTEYSGVSPTTRSTSSRRTRKWSQRCILMTTDPGDLVLDPTCGSGTTAYVAEQWGRRWITIDTSRVALALARTRLMSARYPYYLLADSPEGRARSRRSPAKSCPTRRRISDIRQGFVYERAPHITLKSIANNAEIDVIWEKWQAKLEPLRAQLNAALGKTLGRNGKSRARPRRDMARRRPKAGRTRAWWEGAHRAAEGDRRLDRQGGRRRVALRPALRGQVAGARRRAVHGREPVAASRRRPPTTRN